MENNILAHYGVLGMKWGRRKSSSSASKATLTRNGNLNMSENRKKTVAIAASAVTAAAAAYYVYTHPEAIGKVISKVKDVKVKDLSSKVVDAGKQYVKNAMNEVGVGIKEGAKEGLKEGPKKAVKAVVVGASITATKKALDEMVGKKDSATIFQANDNKKIGKFWKVSPEDGEKDEDD